MLYSAGWSYRIRIVAVLPVPTGVVTPTPEPVGVSGDMTLEPTGAVVSGQAGVVGVVTSAPESVVVTVPTTVLAGIVALVSVPVGVVIVVMLVIAEVMTLALVIVDVDGVVIAATEV